MVADLGEGGPGPGRGLGEPDLAEHLVRLQGGRQLGEEELRRRHGAAAVRPVGDHLGLERHRHARQLGGRVGVAQAAADGPAVADGGMAHVRHRRGDERAADADGTRKLQLALPGHGAADQHPVLLAQIGELAATVQVDQHRRLRHAHVDQRNEALPAGERPRVHAVLGQQGQRLFRRLRREILERRRLHAAAIRTGARDSVPDPCAPRRVSPPIIRNAPPATATHRSAYRSCTASR